MSFQEQAPPPSLARDVELIRITRSTEAEPLTVKTCPNGTPGLVFQRGEGCLPIVSIETRSQKSFAVPELFLHGQGSEPSMMSFAGGNSLILQVILKPYGLYSVFGISGQSLALKNVSAAEFNASDLLAALQQSQSDQALFETMYGFLEQRKAVAGLSDPTVEAVIAASFHQPSAFSTEDLARLSDISVRQLQRRFLKVVGCPIKVFLRLRRANLALSMLQTGTWRQLSDIAYALGYADQSHFIHDIKAFTWVTPARLEQAFEAQSRDGTGFSFV